MAAARRFFVLLVVALAVATPTAVAISYIGDVFREPLIAENVVSASPNLIPGLRQPGAVSVLRANLPDDEPVVGVSVGSRTRAYRLAALAPMFSHVVNDLIDDRPITITYCDRNHCVRAYTGAGTRPLDVWTGGFMGGLMLQFNDRLFWQETGKYADPKQAWTEGGPPLKLFPCTVTTWKSWRDAHPNTDVYVGLWSAAKP